MTTKISLDNVQFFDDNGNELKHPFEITNVSFEFNRKNMKPNLLISVLNDSIELKDVRGFVSLDYENIEECFWNMDYKRLKELELILKRNIIDKELEIVGGK